MVKSSFGQCTIILWNWIYNLVSCKTHGDQEVFYCGDVNLFKKVMQYTPSLLDKSKDTGIVKTKPSKVDQKKNSWGYWRFDEKNSIHGFKNNEYTSNSGCRFI